MEIERPATAGGQSGGVGAEVDALLGSLQEGLRKAEEALSAMLAGVVADNELLVAELEAALSDMEAALGGD
jgi:hypothetical protein